jgi:SAM-dependent methyltransferase
MLASHETSSLPMKNSLTPSRTIRSRMKILAPLLKDKDVLDLGVVDYRERRRDDNAYFETHPTLLFRQISDINPEVTGVDIDHEGIANLRARNFNVVCDNVETMNLDKTFDVIVAGEIIEHLENPGLFLRNALKHINPDGCFAISTPNPFYAKQRHKIWRYNHPQVHEDHTWWFDPATLNELLHRTGWKTTENYWVQPSNQYIKTWPRLFRGYFSNSFLTIAKKADS